MPNKPSARKELRKAVVRQARNEKIKSNLKDLVKKSKKTIEAKGAEAKELVNKALKAFDKAAQKGTIKKNTANRKKSRLQLKLNKS
ncbi:30S ribosomal protein S20 [Patescibacteria group bacterium]|nr:30S ribosomal protein S20 [Patescibacteria group bacterium]MBU0879471.1 30S ribosomal protein S20 [Patescibacteria group bacterium]MBU0880001.1 30S ribosomal protein S20 [Patescibacteria group bacterium]MBU0897693.1 30S ribosomal protein S20 [Patescibacteria group bacterium]MBU1062943.1 30S ribosomal protein S20 [Patescibacteria group bacterium]